MSKLSDIQTRILEKLDANYENDFVDSVPAQELCSTHSLTADLGSDFSIAYRRARCQGIGYDRKPFKGRWKIVHRGLIESQYDGDDFKFHHVITRIESKFFLDRADEGTDKFVRVR